MNDTHEARETLERLEVRLRRDVGDMVAVLVADVPVFVQRTVKRVFERSPHSDGLSDEALAKLKQGTQEAAERLGESLRTELEPLEVWVLNGPLPEEPQGLDDHPKVSAALEQVGAELRGLLQEAGYPASEMIDDVVGYRLPTYFVSGQFMQSLVASYWRTLADYLELRSRIQDEDEADQREQRRSRWDGA